MQVLVVNTGSSSLKLRLLDDRDQVAKSADLPVRAPDVNDRDLTRTLRDWPPPNVVGHRVVHDGTRSTGPVLVDRAVESALRELADLAPLHQPKSLAAFDVVRALLPEVPAVACFDTAFRASLPAEVRRAARGDLPSRRRSITGRGGRRAQRRYHYGLHPRWKVSSWRPGRGRQILGSIGRSAAMEV